MVSIIWIDIFDHYLLFFARFFSYFDPVISNVDYLFTNKIVFVLFQYKEMKVKCQEKILTGNKTCWIYQMIFFVIAWL